MSWLVCSLSSIRYEVSGPLRLWPKEPWAVDRVRQNLLKNLIDSPYLPPDRFPKKTLRKIVEDVVARHERVHDGYDSHLVPPGLSFLAWGPESPHALAFGNFDDAEEDDDNPGMAAVVEEPRGDGARWTRYPNGREITVRRVRDTVQLAFTEYWDESAKQWVLGSSHVSAMFGNPNFFCFNVWLDYLKAWIRWDALPPRSTAFPEDPEPMWMEGELYEIANSRRQEREDHYPFPFIDYGGLEGYMNSMQEDELSSCWDQRTPLFERAIRDGKRGEELMITLARDMGAWQITRTDVWPRQPVHLVTLDAGDAVPTPFHGLPNEVLASIISKLDPPDLAPLTALSRSTRSLFLSSKLLDGFLRHRVLSADGDLRWVLPVSAVSGEEQSFAAACSAWLPHGSLSPDPVGSSQRANPMAHMDFPHYAFMSQAWMHDSMRNRRRMWGIAKQFEALWYKYRTEGWETDTFIASVEDEAAELHALGVDGSDPEDESGSEDN